MNGRRRRTAFVDVRSSTCPSPPHCNGSGGGSANASLYRAAFAHRSLPLTAHPPYTPAQFNGGGEDSDSAGPVTPEDDDEATDRHRRSVSPRYRHRLPTAPAGYTRPESQLASSSSYPVYTHYELQPELPSTSISPRQLPSRMKGAGSNLEDSGGDLRRLLWLRDAEIQRLNEELDVKEAHIEQLKSQLDKFQSVFFIRQMSFPGGSSQDLEGKVTEVAAASARKKRIAISAEPQRNVQDILSGNATKRHAKSDRSRDLIKKAVLENDFLRHLDLEQICELVDCMYPMEIRNNCLIIREGDDGSLVYVMEEGSVEVTKDGRYLCTLSPGKVFGELAILYNCTRTASVRALSPCRLWAINRQTFQAIMMKTGLAKHTEYVNFLKSVHIFDALADQEVNRLADLLEEERFKYGDYIVRQGAQGAIFYIVSKGQLRVTQNCAPGLLKSKPQDKVVRLLNVGDHFGEDALQGEDVRSTNVIVASHEGATCLTLDRETYQQLIHGIKDEKRHSLTQQSGGYQIEKQFEKLRLSDLAIMATLGVGGFGRVELVQIVGDDEHAYALKVMKKQHIIETNQQQHILNERHIMFECNSDFVVQLYRTFRDSKYLYMLMEVCLGGEVWSLLRDRSNFDEHTARFYTACAMEAIEYLHRRGIIYRDLKPENMLTDSYGYAKLVDFGFAKHIGFGRKTWTFCGTPEYVAPEVVLNKGHDFAVDYWSVGIFIFELLTGSPPFSAQDPMRTYNMILKGIDALELPRWMSKNAIVLIKKLCREVPTERLGYGRGAMKELRRNRWFEAFNFDGLRARTLIPPIIPNIKGTFDTSNFDKFAAEKDDAQTPNDTSGWDIDF